MTECVEMLWGMVGTTAELPPIPVDAYGRFDAALRGVEAGQAFTAYWLLWLSLPADYRGRFDTYFLRHLETALAFVRLTGSTVNTAEEGKAWLVLWLVYSGLAQLHMADETPYLCWRFARNLPILLQNWPAGELVKRREAADAAEAERIAAT